MQSSHQRATTRVTRNALTFIDRSLPVEIIRADQELAQLREKEEFLRSPGLPWKNNARPEQNRNGLI